MALDMHWFDEQVASFERQKPLYEEFSRLLQDILERAVRSLGIAAIIQVRAKEVPSFAEKCLRKQDKYVRPVDQFTDLCGARVIVESKGHLQPVCDYLRRNFEIDATNSEDVSGRLRSVEFGYLSIHNIVSFKEGADYHGVTVPRVLYERRTESETREKPGLSPGPRFKAEVQVRTLLQHSWATLVHDHLYKSDFKAPRHLEREAAKIAAKLEDTDDSFARLLEAAQFYRSCYGAYMSPGRIRQEIAILEAVQKHDALNPELAHKIARLALAINDWPKASRVLSNFRDHPSPIRAGILRDLGVALAKQEDPEGRRLLQQAVELDPTDADALCELGDARFATDEREALDCYERACKLKPAYPRALRSLIQGKMLRGEASVVSLLAPQLEAASQTCQEWAKVGVHLPWAYYDLGFFALLLGRPYDSLAAMAKAVELSATESPIQETYRLLEMIREKLRDKAGDLDQQIDWVRRFLLAATVAKILAMEEAAVIEEERLQVEARKAEENLENLKQQPDIDKQDLDEAEKKKKKAAEAHAQSVKHLGALQIKAAGAPATYLSNTDPETRGRREVATPRNGADQPVFNKNENIVIVAGGCDRTVEQKIGEYRYLVEFAFAGFKGTVVSGGTTAGISGIVGDLPNQYGAIKKIAYLPRSTPRPDKVHEAYTIYDTPEKDYSPLGPIQAWIDILASGVRPGAVRVMGINGGEISACEYRLALAMGAIVGILRDSGRAANEVTGDPEWQSSRGLIILPRDDETVRLFVQPPAPAANISQEDRERLARKTHEEHRKDRSKSLLPADPVLVEWQDLIPSFKASSLQQVDHIEAKLARLGLKLRKAKGRETSLFRFEDKGKIEELAKLEHARWNVERLLDGWTLGKRDPQKKTSPYLVTWEELPADAKEWDRRTITSLPRRLKELGYEIYNPERKE